MPVSFVQWVWVLTEFPIAPGAKVRVQGLGKLCWADGGSLPLQHSDHLWTIVETD